MVQKKVKKTQKKSNTKNKSLENSTKVKTQEISILLFASSILLSCLILIKGENVWTFLHNFILGLFGVSAFLLPILLCYTAFAILVSNNSKINLKIWQSVSIIFLFSTTTYLFSNEGKYFEENYFKTLAQLYKSGMTNKGSGLVSGILGVPCVAAFGEVGAKIIILLLLFVAIMLLTGTNLVQLFKAISKPVDALLIFRCRADTMPLVTVPVSPAGLPMATTSSPTNRESESPMVAAGNPVRLIFKIIFT